MGPIAVHRSIRRLRRGLLAAAALLALTGAVVAHHGVPVLGAEHHGMEMIDVAEICLAAFTAVGAAVAALAVAAPRLRAWLPLAYAAPATLPAVRRGPRPRCRAGPAFLCVHRR